MVGNKQFAMHVAFGGSGGGGGNRGSRGRGAGATRGRGFMARMRSIGSRVGGIFRPGRGGRRR